MAGVDVSNQKSENIRDFAEHGLDVVITVCGYAQKLVRFLLTKWYIPDSRILKDGEGIS